MTERPRVKGRGREIFLGENNTTAKQQTVKTAEQQAVEIEKVTFYLPVDVSARLDELKAKLKREFRREKKVTKSQIVRIALEKALGEWSEDLGSFPGGKLLSK